MLGGLGAKPRMWEMGCGGHHLHEVLHIHEVPLMSIYSHNSYKLTVDVAIQDQSRMNSKRELRRHESLKCRIENCYSYVMNNDAYPLPD